MAQRQQMYYADDTPVPDHAVRNMPLSQGEMILAQQAHKRELTSTLGAAGVAGAAQMGLSYINTAQDKRNKEKLAELERREKAGLLGKSAKEDAFLEASLMNPVRTFATQQTQRGEAERASMGATRSARDVMQAQRGEREVVAQAAQQAGLKKAERFFQRKAAELQELEQRTAYESERSKNRLEMLGQTIAGISGLAGKYMAANVQETITPDQLDAFIAQNPSLKGASPDKILKAFRQSLKMTDAVQDEAYGAARYGGTSGGASIAGPAGADNYGR